MGWGKKTNCNLYTTTVSTKPGTRTEPTKSRKAGHFVPDKLEARQLTQLCDVIWHH